MEFKKNGFHLSPSLSILFFVQCVISHAMLAQCPSDQTAFEAGGTFSGDCLLITSGNVNLANTVVWTTGRLTISRSGGGQSDLNLTAQLTFQSGGILDLNDGDLNVNTGGILSVLTGGSIELNGSGNELTINGGTLASAGNLTLPDDFFVSNGGDFDLTAGTLDIGRDLSVDGSGSTFELTGTAILDDVDDINFTNSSSGLFDTGTSVKLMDNLTIDDASLVIAGEVENVDAGTGANDIILNGSASLTVNAGADIKEIRHIAFGADDGGASLTINGGSVNVTDDFLFNSSGDAETVTINGGSLDIGGDIDVDGTNGSIQINSGSTVTASSVNGAQPTDIADLPSQIDLNGGVFELNGVTLPVEWIYFEVKRTHETGKVVILWATASEQNNRGFFIERSSDGSHFETVGFVEGQGTTSTRSNYEYHDESPLKISYYRLKQIDYDGNFEFSSMRYLEVSDTMEMVTCFPNPTRGNVELLGQLNVGHHVAIFSSQGKLLQEFSSADQTYTENEISSLLGMAMPGVYWIQLQSHLGNSFLRVVKEH